MTGDNIVDKESGNNRPIIGTSIQTIDIKCRDCNYVQFGFITLVNEWHCPRCGGHWIW